MLTTNQTLSIDLPAILNAVSLSVMHSYVAIEAPPGDHKHDTRLFGAESSNMLWIRACKKS
jgi:hypothetical protein